MRQLGFVFALAQTNALLAYNYFVKHLNREEVLSKAEFQRKLAREMVFNDDVERELEEENGGMTGKCHTRRTQMPPGATFATKSSEVARGGHELVRLDKCWGRWNGREFPVIKTKYSKLRCSFGCGALTRTFCYCDFNLMLCSQCYGEHIACINTSNISD